MQATFNLSDGIMERLRREAGRRGITMSALVESALEQRLPPPPATPPRRPLHLPTWSGGQPRADIADREALYQILDDDLAGRDEFGRPY